MIRFLIALGCLGILGELQAESLVPGYQRFHAEKISSRSGELLYSELGCANCHGKSPVRIERSGPSLDALSSRVQRDWVIAFLRDPQAALPGSPMPKMTHDLSKLETEALVAFLGSLGKPARLKPPRHANAELGSALYHEMGCVACHAPTPDYRGPHGPVDAIAEEVVAFPDLAAKTGLLELQHFLTHISDFRGDGRMPHFALDAQDAFDLAAHLLDYQSSDPRDAPRVAAWPKASKEKIDAGRKLFFGQSCHACHDVPGKQAYPKVDLDKSKNVKSSNCLDAGSHPGIPSYQLTENQRASLVAYLVEKPAKPAPEEAVDVTLMALNCYACHNRGDKGGPVPETDPFFVGEESLGDSGRLPPPLTGIGHKLKEDWMTGVFQGRHRVRAYLKTAMPAYPAHAATLAKLFTAVDHRPNAPALVSNKADLAAGHQLLGTHGGLNCAACHNWGDKPSPGIPGPDLSDLDHRLRPSWFREYLLNPSSYRPGTLMPPLWPGGQSTVPDILGGDTEKQIAAIWTYIQEGKEAPKGYVEKNGQYELVPSDRPIVQRTFFEKAGGRAILVGFPGGIHVAFNGDRGHPARVWRGRFFDAYETWFLRKAEFQKPLGKDALEFGPPPSPNRFRGYELDKAGNPIFHLQQAGHRFTETYRVKDGKLIRSVTSEDSPLPPVTHPKGLKVETVTDSPRKKTFVYSW